MKKINSISIFCGAHTGNNPNYETAARIFTKEIANKINVVFGGGNIKANEYNLKCCSRRWSKSYWNLT